MKIRSYIHAMITPFIFYVVDATACSCKGIGVKELDESSELVFIGTLKSKSSFLSATTTKLIFSGTHTYKGEASKEHTLYMNKWDCPASFDKNEVYVVFAYKDDDRLETGLCYSWVYEKYPKKKEAFEQFYERKKGAKSVGQSKD